MKMNFRNIVLLLIIVLSNAVNIYGQSYSWSPLINSSGGNGVNGVIYSIASYQNDVVVAGGFTYAGAINAKNIAVWDGSAWSALGSGVGESDEDTVYSLAVFNGALYAGGSFSSAGGNSANNIAKWNGTGWSALGAGTNRVVRSLLAYNSVLAVGGDFSNVGNDIAAWTGSTWQTFGTGFSGSSSLVYALAIFNGQLIAAGRFQQSGSTSVNNIAYWNNTSWHALGSGVGSGSERVYALTVYNSTLIAGGKFSIAGGNNANNIARWTGTVWQNVGEYNDIDNEVDALASFNNNLIAGGAFRFAGGFYSSRICKWNGASWARMITGMNGGVNALMVKDSSLYAAGEFDYAGGNTANSVARWYSQATGTISGLVLYSDNNQPVPSGKVRAFRIDKFTRELVVEDSSLISNGAFSIHGGIHIDTLRVIAFPDDQLDYAPTYYPSTIDWSAALTVVPGANSNNVNIIVPRITPLVKPLQGSATISGHIYLNISIPGNPSGSYPYQRDAVLYVKSGNTFKRFSVSQEDETYVTSQLDPGTYDLFVYRAGYMSAVRTVVLGTINLDTINFHLDSLDIIGLQNISRSIPKEFSLAQNYPNPFNPATSILFSLSKAGHVELTVFNVLGQKVARLVNEDLKPGEYKYNFDAASLPSGVYFYRLKVNDFVDTKKMALIK